jgi:hypothetical protein
MALAHKYKYEKNYHKLKKNKWMYAFLLSAGCNCPRHAGGVERRGAIKRPNDD